MNKRNYESTAEENGDKVHIIIKQYIAPIHMVLFNMCMLKKWSQQILSTIESHRESFGSTSYVIIHSFSSAGSLILCSMNDLIQNKESENKQHLLFYDGIIYDSPHLGPLSLWAGLLVAWELIKINIISQCFCYDTSSSNDNELCGCLFILCKIWYFAIYTLFFIICWLVLFPIIFLFFTLYILITCTADYICCHHKKLLCSDNIRILTVPMLLLGSDTDHINPIKKSIEFIRNKQDKIEQYKMLYAQKAKLSGIGGGDKKVYDASISIEPNEDTLLLSPSNGFERDTEFDIDKFDKDYIKNSHRYYVFDKSEHVKHYQKYPKIYQKEVNKFMDLCLRIVRNNASNSLQDQEVN